VRLLPETVISFFGDENHGHPVISGVTRNLFRANATNTFQNFAQSCRASIGQTYSGLPRTAK